MKSFTFISLLGVLGSSIQITSFNYGFDVQDEQTWNDDNGICLTGTMQSPIDIPLDTGTGLTELEFAYAYQYFDNTTSTILYETTETLELTYTSGLSNVWSNAGISQFYDSYQVIFHAPSEHTFSGATYDLEMQIEHWTYIDGYTDEETGIVYESTFDTKMITSVFFDRAVNGGPEDEFLQAIQNSRLTTSDTAVEIADFNMWDLMDRVNRDSVVNYQGSDTVYPCSEGVQWVLYSEPLGMSSDQLDWFQAYWADNSNFANNYGNNRFVQEANDRSIYYIEAAGSIFTVATALTIGIFGVFNL